MYSLIRMTGFHWYYVFDLNMNLWWYTLSLSIFNLKEPTPGLSHKYLKPLPYSENITGSTFSILSHYQVFSLRELLVLCCKNPFPHTYHHFWMKLLELCLPRLTQEERHYSKKMEAPVCLQRRAWSRGERSSFLTQRRDQGKDKWRCVHFCVFLSFS